MAGSLPEHVARPDFAVSVRGYDRSQVDAYFGRLLEWLADAENRAASAERARETIAAELDELRATVSALEERAGVPAAQSISAFGERMGEVMQSAVRAAEELRAEAEREARERRAGAHEEVEQMLAAARAEADRVVAGAASAKQDFEESIAVLRAARTEALVELGALRDRLSALGELPEPSLESVAPDHARSPRAGGAPPGDPDGAPTRDVDALTPSDVEATGTAVLPAVEPQSHDPLEGLRRLSVEDPATDDETDLDGEGVTPAGHGGDVAPVVTEAPTSVLPADGRRSS